MCMAEDALDNPYIKVIAEDIAKVTKKIRTALEKDKTIAWQSLDFKWSYNNTGAVWLDMDRLVTWQYGDTIKKAFEWSAEQQANRLEERYNAEESTAREKLAIHNRLNAAENIYIRWDEVFEYFSFDKETLRKLKKWHKQRDTLIYHKPVFGSAPWTYPTMLAVGPDRSSHNEIEILLNHVDVEKTLKAYYNGGTDISGKPS